DGHSVGRPQHRFCSRTRSNRFRIAPAAELNSPTLRRTLTGCASRMPVRNESTFVSNPLVRSLREPRTSTEESMNRITNILMTAAVLCISVPAIAHEGHHMAGEKVVKKSITGEVVDMGCWLGHAARGEKHVSCAQKCLNQGMPMGLLTSN